MVFVTFVPLLLLLCVCVSHPIYVRDMSMTFDSWLCNPLIQEDSKVHLYHPTETPTLQQDIFTLMWAEAGAKSSSLKPSSLNELVKRHFI